MFKHTNTVQNFIRTVIFITTFLLVGGFTLLPVLTLTTTGSDFFTFFFFILLFLNVWFASVLAKMFFVLPEWERLVLLKLGKFVGTKGPGVFIIPPFIYSVASILDMRIVTQQVEATATLTQDNVPTRVTAALEFEIEDPRKAVISVKNYLSSVIWLSTEALKNTIGSLDLKELLSNRDEIAAQLKHQIDEEAANYGINVRAVRITDIDTPPELIEELAVIARARRAAEAKQIQAQAEVEVANRMAEASKILMGQEGGFRLREIQNISEMSKEESAMIIIYPYDSVTGKDIASSSVNLIAQQTKNQKK